MTIHRRFRPVLERLESREVLTILPPGFQETLFAGGFGDATCMAFAPDGRLFVCQHEGDLRVIQPNGVVEPVPFLHVDVDPTNEHGLVGMTFDPDFENNGHIYIYYTVANAPIHCRVSRFTADPINPNVAQAGSEHVILELDNLTNNFHVGGDMHFGPDGKLYIGVGEDGVGANSQNGANLLGKMLRINSDGSIPADNPFVGIQGVRGEIYAFGFRNPFRFAIQPKSGVVYVNDVGSDFPKAREEVNRLYWGANYGWPKYEGFSGDPLYTDPLYAYEQGTDPQTGSFNCAITGATFYGPGVRQFPRPYIGDYFFADFCGGWIRRYDLPTGTVSVFAQDTGQFMIDLAVGPNGSLYYLAWDGLIYRIDHVGTSPVPPVTSSFTAPFTSPPLYPVMDRLDAAPASIPSAPHMAEPLPKRPTRPHAPALRALARTDEWVLSPLESPLDHS
jgi:glucose/arabinose dehydrogenase